MKSLPRKLAWLLPLLCLAPLAHGADALLPALTVTNAPGGGQNYSLTIQLLALMTAITLLPAALLMMTAFTRIVIVLAILRQAIGVGQAPPNQVLVGLSVFLTLFVMAPVVDQIRNDAVTPYMDGGISSTVALERAVVPLKGFMLKQTRESDIAAFVRISGGKGFDKPEDVPLTILAPAFVTSELKTAFQIGFLLFIPFLVVDMVIANLLLALGMHMLSPTTVSLPFKLLLFVIADGWTLVIRGLLQSYA